MKCSQCGNENLKPIKLTNFVIQNDGSEHDNFNTYNDEAYKREKNKGQALLEGDVVLYQGNIKISKDAEITKNDKPHLYVDAVCNIDAFICPICGHIEFFSQEMKDK